MSQRSWLAATGLCAFLVLGCQTASNNPLPVPEVELGPEPLPPISIYDMKSSPEVAALCAQHRCSDPGFANKIVSQWAASGAFESLAVRDEARPYRVYIDAVQITPDELAGDLAKAVVAGASLLVVPVVKDTEFRASFRIEWSRQEVASYEFVVPHQAIISLLSEPQAHVDHAAQSVAYSFLQRAIEERAFAPETLASVLGASDYVEGMTVPLLPLGFRWLGQQHLGDPFTGVLLRFESPASIEDNVTAVIYPIRRTHWDDAYGGVLEQEMEIAREEIELGVKEGFYGVASFAETVELPAQAETPRGLWARGVVSLPEESEELTSHILLFPREDKLIKIRVTERGDRGDQATADVVAFGQELARRIVVPPESAFMARQRLEARKSRID
jgi:hypothetical protein